MSTVKCPKCRKPIAFEATKHDACGWNVRAEHQTTYDRCSITVMGRQCYFPATWYPRGTMAPGECRLHCKAPADSWEAAIATSELYHQDLTAGRDVPLFYRAWDGEFIPGYPTAAQMRRTHAELAAGSVYGRQEGETREEWQNRLRDERLDFQQRGKPDPKAWARDILARAERGEPVLSTPLKLAQIALGMGRYEAIGASPDTEPAPAN